MAGGDARARWPLFTAQVLALGAASVYAYPLGGAGTPFGVPELYGSSPVALAPSDDVTYRAYALTIAHAVVSELAPAYALTSGSDVGGFRRGNVNIASGIPASSTGSPWRKRWCAFVRGHSRGSAASLPSLSALSPEIVSTPTIDSGEHRVIGVLGR